MRLSEIICMIFLYFKIVVSANIIRTPSLIRKSYTNCTAKDDFKSDQFDCTLFHRCAFGYQYTYVCPTGTAFDSAKRACNFIEYVPDCATLMLKTTTDETEYEDYSEESTEPAQEQTFTTLTQTKPSTSNQILTTYLNGCKFKLSDFERGIFCKSSTFRSFYPLCC